MDRAEDLVVDPAAGLVADLGVDLAVAVAVAEVSALNKNTMTCLLLQK